MLKGTPVCNLYVFGLELAARLLSSCREIQITSLIYDNEFPA
jgi:hypothetical protein